MTNPVFQNAKRRPQNAESRILQSVRILVLNKINMLSQIPECRMQLSHSVRILEKASVFPIRYDQITECEPALYYVEGKDTLRCLPLSLRRPPLPTDAWFIAGQPSLRTEGACHV